MEQENRQLKAELEKAKAAASPAASEADTNASEVSTVDYAKLDQLSKDMVALAGVAGAEELLARKKSESEEIKLRIRAGKPYSKRLEIAESVLGKTKKAREKADETVKQLEEKLEEARTKLAEATRAHDSAKRQKDELDKEGSRDGVWPEGVPLPNGDVINNAKDCFTRIVANVEGAEVKEMDVLWAWLAEKGEQAARTSKTGKRGAEAGGEEEMEVDFAEALAAYVSPDKIGACNAALVEASKRRKGGARGAARTV